MDILNTKPSEMTEREFNKLVYDEMADGRLSSSLRAIEGNLSQNIQQDDMQGLKQSYEILARVDEAVIALTQDESLRESLDIRHHPADSHKDEFQRVNSMLRTLSNKMTNIYSSNTKASIVMDDVDNRLNSWAESQAEKDITLIRKQAEEYTKANLAKGISVGWEVYEQDASGHGIERWHTVKIADEPFKASEFTHFQADLVKPDSGNYASTQTFETLPKSPDFGDGYELSTVVGFKNDGSYRMLSYNHKYQEWEASVPIENSKMETYTAVNQQHSLSQALQQMEYCRSDEFKNSSFENRIEGLSDLLKELDYANVYPNREAFRVYQNYVSERAKDAGIKIDWDKLNDNEVQVSRQKYLAEMAINREGGTLGRLNEVTPYWHYENPRRPEISDFTALKRINESKAALDRAYPKMNLDKAILAASNRLAENQSEKEAYRQKVKQHL